MKRLDVPNLMETCLELNVPEGRQLVQTLLDTLDTMATRVADTLGVKSLGVSNDYFGMLASFEPLREGDPCPMMLELFDDEGMWVAPRRKVLLLSNESREHQASARAAFEARGMDVLEARTPSMAWELSLQCALDLVVTEPLPPGTEGAHLLQRITANGGRDSVPIITLATSEQARAEAEGADRVLHLPQPVNWDRLASIVLKLFEENDPGPGLTRPRLAAV